MINLEEIRKRVLQGKNIEEIVEKFDWKEFESLVAEIFRKNEFKVKQNLRFKTKRRYEIDLIAIRGNFVLCVDCKEWSRGRYKKSSLRKALKKQEERVKEFKKFLKKNKLAMEILKIGKNPRIYPLLITLFQEDLVKENNTLIIPLWKLNSFLTEIESFLNFSQSL